MNAYEVVKNENEIKAFNFRVYSIPIYSNANKLPPPPSLKMVLDFEFLGKMDMGNSFPHFTPGLREVGLVVV